jgi:peptidoglycan hydrolase-like protein with peptidoglycan-binding domain
VDRFAFGHVLLSGIRRRPADAVGIAVLLAAIATILTNALFLQKGAHPAPILGAAPPSAAVADSTGSLIAIPRPRPAELQTATKDAAKDAVKDAAKESAARARAALITDLQRELARKGFYEGPLDGMHGPKMESAIRDFEQAAGLKPTGEPNDALLRAIARAPAKTPPRPQPASRRPEQSAQPATAAPRVVAVQRALTDFGYGQLKPTGVVDDGTRAAIEKFERERKLPTSGQLSGRMLRELASLTGRALE